MRLLLLSDIHANIEALDASLAAAPEYDFLINLGDSVGYGAAPNEVLERLRPLGGIIVRGNHDCAVCGLSGTDGFNPMAAAAVHWSRRSLPEEKLIWMRSWPQGPLTLAELPGVQFVHGSPLDENGYVSQISSARHVFATTSARITFFGHTHLQTGFGTDNGQIVEHSFPGREKTLSCHKVHCKRGMRYLVNPGSVGQPRDNDPRAAFALYDSQKDTISYYRVPYNIDVAQARIISAGLPPRLAWRLSEGR